ncbi:MAG: YgjP-like metallopeptidase domain-containing protein [Victivallales bacterium]
MKSDASFSVILPLSRTKREYSIRRSARASRLTLKVSPAGAVEVVIPYFTSYSEAQSFVEKNSLWLERTLRKFVNRPAVPAKRNRNTIRHISICVFPAEIYRFSTNGKMSAGLVCQRRRTVCLSLALF